MGGTPCILISYSTVLIGEIEMQASIPSLSHFYIISMSGIGLFHLSVGEIKRDALTLSHFLYHLHLFNWYILFLGSRTLRDI
jgi:hypothetical protein